MIDKKDSNDSSERPRDFLKVEPHCFLDAPSRRYCHNGNSFLQMGVAPHASILSRPFKAHRFDNWLKGDVDDISDPGAVKFSPMKIGLHNCIAHLRFL